MRKNIESVLRAWEQGTRLNGPSCSTDGEHVFSYSTCILADTGGYTPGKPRWIFNAAKFSATTSQQQSGIRFYLNEQGHTFETVTVAKMGATAADLLAAAGREACVAV